MAAAALLAAVLLALGGPARSGDIFHSAPSVGELLTSFNAARPTAERYPWSAIGRFRRPIAGGCTGVLIGRRIVLTAAHCLFDPYAKRWLPARSLVFTAADRVGTTAISARGSDYRVAPGYQPSALPTLLAEGNDLALVLLSDPLGDDAGFIPWLRSSELKPALALPGGALFEAGYPESGAGAMRLRAYCRIAQFFEQRQVFTHSCVSLKGESGSPVLAMVRGRYSVAGIEVGAAGVRADGRQAWGAATTLHALERTLRAWPGFAPLDDRDIWGAVAP